MSQPDLFVVCKNCGSEVSPYVTECPYCGQRVRKRAPNLERGAEPEEPKPKRRAAPRLSRLRPGEVAGITPDTRPYATMALIAAAMVVTLLAASGALALSDIGAFVASQDEQPWRLLTTAFVHDSLAYAFVGLVAIGIFGTLLERRFGGVLVVLTFLAAGTGGAAAAAAVDLPPLFEQGPLYLIQGANGAALGLLAAWLVDDRRAVARGDDRGSDLTGVYVLAVLLVLLPVAVTEASVVTGVVGGLVGALIGLLAHPILGRS